MQQFINFQCECSIYDRLCKEYCQVYVELINMHRTNVNLTSQANLC